MDNSEISEIIVEDNGSPAPFLEGDIVNHKNSDVQLKVFSDLIDEVLEGKSEDFKKKVLDYVLSCGLDPKDPLLLLMVGTGRLQTTLEDAPKALDVCLESWTRELSKSFDTVEKLLIERQKVAISNAALSLVNDVVQKVNISESKKIRTAIIPASLILGFALTIGVFLGVVLPPWLRGVFGGGYSQVRANTLTWQEVNAMRWGLSKEGKFAKNLINWNKGYLDNGQCLGDAQKLGISFSEYGRVAKSGYCVVWATSPDKRKFKNYK